MMGEKGKRGNNEIFKNQLFPLFPYFKISPITPPYSDTAAPQPHVR